VPHVLKAKAAPLRSRLPPTVLRGLDHKSTSIPSPHLDGDWKAFLITRIPKLNPRSSLSRRFRTRFLASFRGIFAHALDRQVGELGTVVGLLRGGTTPPLSARKATRPPFDAYLNGDP